MGHVLILKLDENKPLKNLDMKHKEFIKYNLHFILFK